MCKTTTLNALLAGGLTILGIANARAETVYSDCCGPLYYHVHQDGALTGEYPKQHGRIDGWVAGDGSASGFWFQPKSDHFCSRARGGTYAWGRFALRNVDSPGMSGEWGYCDEIPDQGWGFH